jgi:hypothetical protein
MNRNSHPIDGRKRPRSRAFNDHLPRGGLISATVERQSTSVLAALRLESNHLGEGTCSTPRGNEMKRNAEIAFCQSHPDWR